MGATRPTSIQPQDVPRSIYPHHCSMAVFSDLHLYEEAVVVRCQAVTEAMSCSTREQEPQILTKPLCTQKRAFAGAKALGTCRLEDAPVGLGIALLQLFNGQSDLRACIEKPSSHKHITARISEGPLYASHQESCTHASTCACACAVQLHCTHREAEPLGMQRHGLERRLAHAESLACKMQARCTQAALSRRHEL